MRVVEIMRVQAAIPMHADPIKVRFRLFIGVKTLRPRHNVILVVIKPDDLDAGLLLMKHRAQMITDEGRLKGRKG